MMKSLTMDHSGRKEGEMGQPRQQNLTATEKIWRFGQERKI
jgi:hypothetical protein